MGYDCTGQLAQVLAPCMILTGEHAPCMILTGELAPCMILTGKHAYGFKDCISDAWSRFRSVLRISRPEALF